MATLKHFSKVLAIFVTTCTIFVTCGTSDAATLAHWSFDETAVDTAPGANDFADDSGNAHHANINDETKVNPNATGVFGSGVSIDGTAGAYLITPYVPGFHTSDFTMAAWVHPNDNGTNTIFGDWKSPYAFRTWVDGSLRMQLRRGSGGPIDIVASSHGSIVTTGYQHVAVVWDRTSATTGTLTSYINGVPVGTANASGGGLQTVDIINNNRLYNIGWKQDSSGDTFNGLMDELWIVNVVLDQTRIQALMDQNVIIPEPSTLGLAVFGLLGPGLYGRRRRRIR